MSAPHPPAGDSSRAWRSIQACAAALDTLCTVDVRWAASDDSFSIKDVDVGLEADLGTPTWVPKLIGNASLLHELALSAHMFGAEEAKPEVA
jgi:enoyl-CoA hydratase/carnithine racemase